MTTPDPREPARISDPRVDVAWRRLSAEEPPASLDAAILAAARREVGAKPQRTDAREALAARRHWWPLAAAATVAAIAVGVLQLTPPDRLGAPVSETTNATDMPMPRPPATALEPFPAAPPAPAKEVASPPPSAVDGRAERAPPGSAPIAGAAASRPSAPAANGMPQRALEGPSARPAPLAKTAAGRTGNASADEARANDRGPLPVSDWIALIRRLRDEGKSADAARELAAFRAAHADHANLLPPDLRDWRAPEK
jgi:hypothetical protein